MILLGFSSKMLLEWNHETNITTETLPHCCLAVIRLVLMFKCFSSCCTSLASHRLSYFNQTGWFCVRGRLQFKSQSSRWCSISEQAVFTVEYFCTNSEIRLFSVTLRARCVHSAAQWKAYVNHYHHCCWKWMKSRAAKSQRAGHIRRKRRRGTVHPDQVFLMTRSHSSASEDPREKEFGFDSGLDVFAIFCRSMCMITDWCMWSRIPSVHQNKHDRTTAAFGKLPRGQFSHWGDAGWIWCIIILLTVFCVDMPSFGENPVGPKYCTTSPSPFIEWLW